MIEADGVEMDAYMAYPSPEGSHPAVLVVQEMWGVNGYIQSIATKFAGQDFFATIPALFHREWPGIGGYSRKRKSRLRG
jgi:carboxymethylenebutenolidase